MNSDTLLQEQSQDISKKALASGSLSKELFEEKCSRKIRDYALKTKFITGMFKGSLSPTQFGRYMIQDIVYLANAAKMYSDAAQKMKNTDETEFYNQQASKYENFYKGFLTIWNLKRADSEVVDVGQAFKTYIGYQQEVVNERPIYLPVAMLPCTMLWQWLAGHENVDKQSPYYEDWFKPNMPKSNHTSSTVTFVDKNKAKFDEKNARPIFLEGMLNELNAFREACNEKTLNLSEICEEKRL